MTNKEKQLILGQNCSKVIGAYRGDYSKIPYWPDYNLGYRGLEDQRSGLPWTPRAQLAVHTKLRKEHEGVWYLEYHYRPMQIKPIKGEIVAEGLRKKKELLLKEVRRSIYLSLLFGEVDPNLRNISGPAWPKDPSQVSELKRLGLDSG